jgi:hypothetical protein
MKGRGPTALSILPAHQSEYNAGERSHYQS